MKGKMAQASLALIVANYLIRNADSSSIVTVQETDAAGSKIKNMFILQALLAF